MQPLTWINTCIRLKQTHQPTVGFETKHMLSKKQVGEKQMPAAGHGKLVLCEENPGETKCACGKHGGHEKLDLAEFGQPTNS